MSSTERHILFLNGIIQKETFGMFDYLKLYNYETKHPEPPPIDWTLHDWLFFDLSDYDDPTQAPCIMKLFREAIQNGVKCAVYGSGWIIFNRKPFPILDEIYVQSGKPSEVDDDFDEDPHPCFTKEEILEIADQAVILYSRPMINSWIYGQLM